VTQSNGYHETGDEVSQERLKDLAAEAEKHFENPLTLPGRPQRNLSPLTFAAATQQLRTDVDAHDDLLWLTEASIGAVEKEGIVLDKQWFWDQDLESLTTGRAGMPRRDLRMLYNRADLARGILREIIIGERDAQGRFSELLRCERRDEALQKLDLTTFLARREEYLGHLLASRTLAENDYLAIERGTEAITQRVNAMLARERNQRKGYKAPIAATPIRSTDEAERRRKDREYDALADALAATGGVSGTTQNLKDSGEDRTTSIPHTGKSAKSLRGRNSYKGMRAKPLGEATTSGTAPQATVEPRASLDDALGGSTGFTTASPAESQED
jgi:hypothetical protein